MYKVTCDGKLLHSDDLQGLKIVDGELSLELGKTGVFDFIIYPQHPYYEYVKPVISIVEVYRNELSIFRGRVLNIKYGFYNEKQVSCEGELAFLLDSIIAPHAVVDSFSAYLDYIVSIHNEQVEAKKRFVTGSVTVPDFWPFEVVEDFEFLTSLETLNKRMVEPSGGYLQARHEYGTMYLDLLAPEVNLANASKQKIRLGKNLLDLEKDIKGSEVFSGIVPLGAKIGDTENRLDISMVNGGSYSIVNDAAVAAYGRIFKVVVFDDITDAATLFSEAKRYLAENFASVNTIEITAADLSGANPDLDSFNVGQWVEVVSNIHFNEPQSFLINKIVIKISDPANTKIVAGRTKRGLTDHLGNAMDDLGSLRSQMQKVASSIGSISTKAATAETKAINAETKATNAETKASSAETKATSAETKANNAATAASNAATKATTAETKANTATTAASNATTAANNAATKATTATQTANAASTKADSLATRVSALEAKPYVTATGTTGIWKWQKFSDNTCEFFGKVPVTAYDITMALGGWFRGANVYGATDYAYPFAMTEAPAVELTFQTRNGLAAIAWVFSADATTAQSYLPQCYLIRPVTGSGIYGNINIIGKGKLA
jgi:hypothetical protein